MNYPELRPSNANYSAAEYVSRVAALFARDDRLLGPIVQRSALSRSAAGQIEHIVTKINVLDASASPPLAGVWDYESALFISENLDRETLFQRLGGISNKRTLAAGEHVVTSSGLGFSDRYEAGGNSYCDWPCRVLTAYFGSAQVSFEPLVHPDLKTLSSAFEGVREFLSFPDFNDNDGRKGHILLCIPNFNARLGRLVLRGTRLQIPVQARIDRASLKLDLSYKANGQARSMSIRCDNKEQVAIDFEFTPTEMRLWLISTQGFLADFHEENEYYATGQNPVLAKPTPSSVQNLFGIGDSFSAHDDLPLEIPETPVVETRKISEVTRQGLADLLLLRNTPFHGRLDLMSFLKRVWPLGQMVSSDQRFQDAAGDIWQHVVNNNDWSYSELLHDRLNILTIGDEQFGRFLELCVHPLVLGDENEATELVEAFNLRLRNDAFLMEESGRLSGRAIYKLTAAVGDPQFGKAFEIVLSFAGEDREYVEAVAAALRAHKVSVFYDGYEQATLWGKDLVEHLHYIYSASARFCVMFISRHYAEKMWPTHERRSAFERALEEQQEYILPARFDDTSIPGLRKTVGYVDLKAKTPEQLAALILQKLGRQD
jgi:hypothetical protein